MWSDTEKGGERAKQSPLNCCGNEIRERERGRNREGRRERQRDTCTRNLKRGGGLACAEKSANALKR